MEFNNLTYQDFYEDKILLMEYDLTPKEITTILKTKNIFYDKLILNNQTYDLFVKKPGIQHHVYILTIVFTVEHLRDYISLHKALNKLPDNWEFKNTEIEPKLWRYVFYEHPIPLSWEDITDKSYLNFIIKSSSEYLKKTLEEYVIHSFKDIPISSYNTIPELVAYFNRNNIRKINIQSS